MFGTKILLATDDSPESERAMRMGIQLSNAFGLELHLVHVVPAPSAYSAQRGLTVLDPVDPELQGRLHAIAESEARGKLYEQVEKARELGGQVAGTHPRVGRPGAQIVNLAEELDAGLIVLGGPDSGSLKRALLGNTSDFVVRHAPCPVLMAGGEERG